jgi:hypothetical protein
MDGCVYSTDDAAADAAEYAAAAQRLAADPDDADAAASIRELDEKYGVGFFED